MTQGQSVLMGVGSAGRRLDALEGDIGHRVGSSIQRFASSQIVPHHIPRVRAIVHSEPLSEVCVLFAALSLCPRAWHGKIHPGAVLVLQELARSPRKALLAGAHFSHTRNHSLVLE